MIKEEIVECDFHLPYGEGARSDSTIFRAYKIDDGKIIITIKDGDEDERVFCNYLKDEFEMDEFFNGISVEEYIMDNATFGTHYPYGENPKCDTVTTSFSIYDEEIDKDLYFFEGLWSLQYEDEEDEIVEDRSYKDREELIWLYVKTYLDDFFSVQETENKNDKNILQDRSAISNRYENIIKNGTVYIPAQKPTLYTTSQLIAHDSHNFLDEISSIHIFHSGKTIVKYPLDRKENVVLTFESLEMIQELQQKLEESGKWRIVKVNDVFHAVKNPDGNLTFDIPKGLDFSGRPIIFGETGSGKSTLLSYIGRLAVSNNQNVFTIESPRALSIEDATRLDNNESAINTVLLCRPDLVLFDEVRNKKHFAQLKQLSLACTNIIGSFHASEIFEALARFSSMNGDRSYGELSTITNKFVHIYKGNIINWYTLETTLSSRLKSEFYCDGERPVTEIRDKNNNIVGWLFYFANDINIVKNKKYYSDGNKKKNNAIKAFVDEKGGVYPDENKKKNNAIKVFVDEKGGIYPDVWSKNYMEMKEESERRNKI